MREMLLIYIDADACPVKDEVYKVAKRHALQVIVVANAAMRVPFDNAVRLEVVSDGFDAADDWIVDNAGPGDIVITSDIPLADRSLKKGAFVLGNTGRPFTEENIGDALASREISQEMREMGLMRGGPAPFQPKDLPAQGSFGIPHAVGQGHPRAQAQAQGFLNDPLSGNCGPDPMMFRAFCIW
jgi:uncharacterized protein